MRTPAADRFLRYLWGFGVVAALGASACMSARNHPALDAAQNLIQPGSGAGAGGGAAQAGEPVVEAYIEYPGPQERWAGPASFVLHVQAKDPHWALVHAAPAWFNEDSLARGALGHLQANTRGLSSDFARERLRYLASVVQGGPEISFKGCLTPVRVRLIRADGLFVEKTGCRGETGWPRAASELVEYFLTAKLRGNSSANDEVAPAREVLPVMSPAPVSR